MWTWFGTWTPDLKLQGILIATEDAHKFNQQLSACISSISITLWVIAYMPGSTNYLILYDGYEFQKHHCKITWWSLKSGEFYCKLYINAYSTWIYLFSSYILCQSQLEIMNIGGNTYNLYVTFTILTFNELFWKKSQCIKSYS